MMDRLAKSARMPGETYEPMPAPPVPYCILRRRARVRLIWWLLAGAAVMIGGYLGVPPLLVEWFTHHG